MLSRDHPLDSLFLKTRWSLLSIMWDAVNPLNHLSNSLLAVELGFKKGWNPLVRLANTAGILT
jgi:hypothetical protein